VPAINRETAPVVLGGRGVFDKTAWVQAFGNVQTDSVDSSTQQRNSQCSTEILHHDQFGCLKADRKSAKFSESGD